MSAIEMPTPSALFPEPAVINAAESPRAPEPSATGNSKLDVLSHRRIDAFLDPQDNSKRFPAAVELSINNASDTTIATAIFEALFYDIEGNVLDTIKHKEIDLPPGRSRRVRINSLQYEEDKVESYAVRLIRMRTADAEKVQPRRHDIFTATTGEQVVAGIVKNLSRDKTDAAVIITFYNLNKEIVGTKVVVLRDIEPDTISKYEIRFKPPEGETVASYSIAIGELAA